MILRAHYLCISKLCVRGQAARNAYVIVRQLAVESLMFPDLATASKALAELVRHYHNDEP